MQHRYRPRPARTSYKSSSYKEMFERVPPQTVQDREKWRCRQCGKEVSNPWHHSHTHRQERFYCPQCGNSYNRIDSLKAHYRSAHTHAGPAGGGGGPGGPHPHPHHPGLQAGQHLPPLPLSVTHPGAASAAAAAAAAAHGAPPNHNSH
ncbi:Sex determination protein fruitless [Frankliniella fusca]|uniref:Sex determination protein fruitless n=1 Tax=Frankliniella fusca TaxID=407009 RepID=A0AAE1H0N9_9NEOP|nr:Sex determination protein fruitless [Frankliniella fusca]